MKMETVVHAPFAARVKELLVITGSQVETGGALIKLEPLGDGAEEAVAEVGPDLDLPAADEGIDPEARGARARAALTAVVLGYDVPPEDQDAALSEYLAVRDEVRADGESVLADELDLLTIFADLAELSRNRPVDEDRHTELRVHSSREHFHTFLQSLDVERGGLPEQFRDRLVRVLVHYGVEDLERTPELEAAVFRIFLAQQRSTPEVALASAVLGCWSDETPPTGPLAARARALLERLGRVTQSRYPVIGDLARSVRFRWFDQPAVDAERSDILLGVRDELVVALRRRRHRRPGASDRGPGGHPRADRALPGRAARARRPGSRADAGGARPAPLPRVRPARPAVPGDRRATGRGRGLHAGRPADPAGVGGRHGRGAGRPSGDLVTTLTGHVDSRGADEEAVADLYLHWGDAPEAADEASERLRSCCPRCRWLATYDASAWRSAPAATVRSATTCSAPTTTASPWSRTT